MLITLTENNKSGRSGRFLHYRPYAQEILYTVDKGKNCLTCLISKTYTTEASMHSLYQAVLIALGTDYRYLGVLLNFWSLV